MKIIFITDCEGPISKNDNAFETISHFIPDGDKLFTLISKYDDVLADVLKKLGYNAGDTLKLVLPFLKAYDVTDRKMREFSAQNLLLISNVKDTLQHVRKIAYTFVVSTSYEHYIQALCQTLDFPFENTYCTKLKIDKYSLSKEEKIKLKKTAKEITQMSMIEIPLKARSQKDFSEKDQKTIQRLNEIFWEEIMRMECGKIFDDVNPVGGSEKADAIRDAVQKVGSTLKDVVYVGDSITDVEAFRLVREKGGLAVSFNGNQYAVKNAEIAILSESSLVTSIIADAFIKSGKEQTLNLVKNWSFQALKNSQVEQNLIDAFSGLQPSELPKVKIITSENMEILTKESSEFRKRVRGKSIGRLG